MLQDGNYNVVALLGQTGQVLEQYVWDPYGTPVVKHTSATPAPVNRVGHQGLFWHSLDGSATFNTPDPTATGLYYNRNRWYAPHLGRFLQRDPNETAMLVLDTLARNGQLAAGLLNAFDAVSHFGSGMNLYGYAGGNPITGADPLGLYDPFDEVDSIIADMQGERAANAAHIIRAMEHLLHQTQIMALEALIVATVPGGAALVGAWHLGYGAGDIFANGFSVGNVLQTGFGALGVGSGARQLLRFMGSGSRIRGAHNGAKGICFAAGTLVLMADGPPKPIEQVQLADLVLCHSDPSMGGDPQICSVNEVFVSHASCLLDITFGTVLGSYTVSATPEHPFWMDEHSRYVPAKELAEGDVLSDGLGDATIVRIEQRQIQTTVYNIETNPAHTYYICDAGGNTRLLVHNMCMRRFRAEKGLRGSQKHGVHWTEGSATAKSLNKPQGRFVSEQDVRFLEDMAESLEAGYSAPAGGLPLPPGHGMVVHMPNGSVVPATRIWFKIRPSGVIHGYPMP